MAKIRGSQKSKSPPSSNPYDLERIRQMARESSAGPGKHSFDLLHRRGGLVVNGDSEQVIVATCNRRGNGLPHITYQAGSLENAAPAGRGIRHQVCRILEGGSDAFQKRERRYSLPERRD
jgi:hypothetical protein